MTVLIVIGVLLTIMVIWFIVEYNNFIKLGNKVGQSASGIDVYLKQRFDLIPKIVETVKGYAKYEKNMKSIQ